MVVLPVAIIGFYLFARANDQYISTVGFSVRSEETGSAADLLGGLTGISSASSSDTDILYEYIQSQELVVQVNEDLDLHSLFSKAENDPFFSLPNDASIEALVEYWNSMVRLYYDSGTGLIEIRAHAFDPIDAQSIATAIFTRSSEMINRLSDVAQADATGYAKEELDRSVERLRNARQVLTQFRIRTQIVDPSADVAGQMGLLNTLQAQLAEALIDLDLLKDSTRTSDPRVEQGTRKIEVIEQRIEEERQKLGVGVSGQSSGGFAELFGEFERLQVDREFAENSYLLALAAHDAAVAEAQRKSRYLTAYVQPTLAQTPQAPNRWLLLGVCAGLIFLTWSILVLIFYSLRDRK